LPVSEGLDAREAELAQLAITIRDAGALALKKFGQPLKSWIKGHDSPVTEVDIAVNDLLLERLLGPGDGWLSEESENDPRRLAARRVWVVDPIDGTRAYIAGREDWSISVALVEDGRPVLAALHAPVTDELFLATQGRGATRNGGPMQPSDGDGLDGARVAGPKRVLDRMVERHAGLLAVPRVYSLALRMVRVAQGTLDAAIAAGRSADWDLAAADLLVHEAGGIMTALDGQPLLYNRPEPVHGMLVASGRRRHAAIIELVRAQAS
jgi:myo-inositol-1(or 4)-monophosphatase